MLLPRGRPPTAEVAIDAALVEKLLTLQHADLADLTLGRRIEGWDNVTFRLGDDLAVRVPRRAIAAPLIANEQRWLPILDPHLPIAVPAPVRIGAPGQGYPWAWSVVPWIEGQPAALGALPSAEAARLGQFLGALHAIPSHPAAPKNPFRGVPLGARRSAIERRLEDLRTAGLPAGLEPHRLVDILQTATHAPLDAVPCWLHGDLHSRNVVARDGKISGIIDCGDICVGDAATDLAAVWILFDPEDHPRFWQAYGSVSEATMARASGWAVAFGSMLWGATIQPTVHFRISDYSRSNA